MAFPPYGTQRPISAGIILTSIRCPLLEYIARAVWRVRADPIDRAAAHGLARDQASVGFEKGASALLLAAGARHPDRAGDPLARARQLVSDGLSCRDHPRHRSRCLSSTGEILFSRLARALHLAFAVALAIVPAFAQQWPLFERLQFLSRVVGWHDVADVGARETGRAPLWLDPRRYAGDGGRAALLSARRAVVRFMSGRRDRCLTIITR